MLTIRPPPAARMCGSTSREQRISEKTFTSRSATQFSSVSVSNVPGWAPPALLTRKSMPPSASAERATKARTCSGSVTSAVCAYPAPISSAVATTSCSLREQIATRAPSATSSLAIASPSPFDPPVTSPRRPSRLSLTSSASRSPTRRASPAVAARRRRRRASSRGPRPCAPARRGYGAPRRRRRRRPPTRRRRARTGASLRGCTSAARSRANAAARCTPAREIPGRSSSARRRSAAVTGHPSAAPSGGRPSGSASPSARSQERPQARDPLVDLLLVDEAEGQAEAVSAAAVREEERPRNGGDALLHRPARQVDRVDSRQRQPGEEAALRRRPMRRLWHRASQRRQHPLALPPVERPGSSQLLVDPTPALRLLEEPLAEGAGALIGQLLRCDESAGHFRGADRPAEADTGEERLRRRPGLDDDVRAEAPQARQRLVLEAELPVRDVLDDEEAVSSRELHKRGATIGRETDSARVLMIRNRVDELGSEAAGEPLLQLLDGEAVRVERHRDERRLEAAEGLDRAEVGRRLDDDHVAWIEERLPDQLERLDRTARNQQLVLGRPTALEPLEPIRERLQRACEAARGRVLEGAQLVGGRELLQQRRDPLARERLRVGKATGEGDDIGSPEEREHGSDPVADVPACPHGGECLPASRVRRHCHAANPKADRDWDSPLPGTGGDLAGAGRLPRRSHSRDRIYLRSSI